MDTPAGLPDFSKFDLERNAGKIEVLHEEEGVYLRFLSHGDIRFLKDRMGRDVKSGVNI